VARYAVIVDYPDICSFNVLYDILFQLKRKTEGNTRPYAMFSRKQIHKGFQAHQFGNTVFQPEFFFPMVLHRKLQNRYLSERVEAICKKMRLTNLFGSPVICAGFREQQGNRFDLRSA
jgi:hypothetical protein